MSKKVSESSRISEIEALFSKKGKSDVFSLNKPLISEIVSLEISINEIQISLSGNEIVRRPSNPKNFKVNDSERILLQMRQQHAYDMALLNKLYGSIEEAKPENPISVWIKSHKDE